MKAEVLTRLPLWFSLDDATRQALVDYQSKHYKIGHRPPPAPIAKVTFSPKLESLDEIAYIMRQPPGPKWRDE